MWFPGAAPGREPDAPQLRAYPAIARHVREASLRFDIPEHWIRAVMHVESAGNVHATSTAGAMGLMQVMPETWQSLTARYTLGGDPYDARASVLAGTAYLREMLDRFGSPGFLAAYNAGPGRYEQYLSSGRPLPVETRAYVARLAPMIGGADAAGGLVPARQMQPSRIAWSAAPLFSGRPAAPAGAAAVPRRRGELADGPVIDSLFVIMSGHPEP